MSVEKKVEPKNIIDGKPAAYTTVMSPGMDKFQVVVVREDECGYRPVADYGERSQEDAERIARQLNERLGVSKEEALRILLSSLKASNQSRQDAQQRKRRGGRA
jgi:hypothetical protein